MKCIFLHVLWNKVIMQKLIKQSSFPHGLWECKAVVWVFPVLRREDVKTIYPPIYTRAQIALLLNRNLGYVVISPKEWREPLTASALDFVHKKEKLLTWPDVSSDFSCVFLCSVTGMEPSVPALGERAKWNSVDLDEEKLWKGSRVWQIYINCLVHWEKSGRDGAIKIQREVHGQSEITTGPGTI